MTDHNCLKRLRVTSLVSSALTTTGVVCDTKSKETVEVSTEQEDSDVAVIRRRDYVGKDCLNINCTGTYDSHPRHDDVVSCNGCLDTTQRWMTKREALLHSIEVGL